MRQKLNRLKSLLQDVYDLGAAGSLLGWDQAVFMPPGGAAARGRQMGLLSRLAHQRLTDPEIGRLLEDLVPYEQDLPEDCDDAGLIRAVRREYTRAVRVPADFMAELTAHCAAIYDAWTKARPANDFASVRPYLEKTLEMSRTLANFFPGYAHIADPLIDYGDQGVTAQELGRLFSALRERLVPMVRIIASRAPPDDSPLHRSFDPESQIAFGLEAAKRFGYDMERGRVDKSPHPFTTRFSIGDVRITTRVRGDDLGDCLFSIFHEAGHAIYEQQISPAYEGTPMGQGVSMGVHESQSRLWENVVGRSLPFWSFFYPRLQALFPEALKDVSLEAFYGAINRSRPSLIRVDADEVTYNLHVMVRFDLELALLEGKLSVRELPDAWREAYRSDLGIEPKDDRDGVLQDMHWFAGVIGGQFQGYSIGNVLSAQLFESATASRPGILSEMKSGEFGSLRGWLTENVYRHGARLAPTELVARATGGPLCIGPYIRYLTRKYGEIYDLRGFVPQ
jgi:carboxypeptidase Taq